MLSRATRIEPQDMGEMRNLGRILRGTKPKGELAVLPQPVYALLKEIVDGLADGKSLVLLHEEKQLTTQQAGEILGMSRPYVIRLLDEGEMPYTLVGKHRRVALRDVMAFVARRRSALNQIAREAYDSGLYADAGIPEGGQDE